MRTSVPLAAIVVIASSLLGACQRDGGATAASAARESRTLCLAPSPGAGRAEAALAAAQRGAETTPQAGRWVAAGREWVREARQRADPGFYLNVQACADEALAAEPDFLPARELEG